jgi:hypothetical protein
MSMPIILAIEPDRRQAGHVAAVVRNRIGAELILAETTEGALDAIGSRVPDLVLVPALLSPQDDAALAAALRVIAAAAHVRTLTIPVFSNGTSRSEGGGLLARFRRGRSESAQVGCDPAVFAEQITDYLREAAAERADLASAYESIDEPAPIAAAAVEPPPVDTVDTSEWPITVADAPAAVLEPPVAVVESPIAAFEAYVPEAYVPEPYVPEPYVPSVHEAPPAVLHMDAVNSVHADPTPLDFLETTTELFADRAVAHEPAPEDEPDDDEIVIDLSDEIVEISPETSADELFGGEPFGVYTLSLEDSLDTPIDAVARLSKVDPVEQGKAVDDLDELDEFEDVEDVEDVEDLEGVEAVEATAPAEAIQAVAEISAAADIAQRMSAAPRIAETVVQPSELKRAEDSAWLSLGLRYTRHWPALEGVAVETATLSEALAAPLKKIAAVDERAPLSAAIVTPPPAPPAPPTPPSRPDHLEWAELVASLRQDIERRRNQPAAAAIVTTRPTEAQTRMQTTDAVQSRRSKKASPIQDEWGFFDPQQCGFAALLAKLDEFSDGPDEPKAPPAPAA